MIKYNDVIKLDACSSFFGFDGVAVFVASVDVLVAVVLLSSVSSAPLFL